MAYNGEVRIGTKIDNAGVKRGVKEIERDIAKATKELEKLTSGKAEPQSMKSMRREIVALEKDLKAAERAAKPMVDEFEKAVAKVDELRSTGFSDDQIQDQIAAVDRLAESLRPVDDNMQSIRDKLTDMREKMDAIRFDPSTSVEAGNIRAEIERLNDELNKAGSNTSQRIKKIGHAAKIAARTAVSCLRRVGSAILTIGKGAMKAVGTLRSMGRAVLSLGRNSRNASNGLDRLRKRITNLALGALVFSVIRRGLNNLVQDLGRVLMANQEFANSWNAVKVNLLTAFAPLWEVIQPALISFMQILARVTAMLAQFMATMFGKTVAQARSSAQALNSQAQAANNAGGAAKKQAKAMDDVAQAAEEAKTELADFDEINQQSADTAKDTGANLGDLGDDLGGIGGGGLNFNIGEPEHFSWLDDFAKKLKTFFKDIDEEYWYGLGEKLAGKIADGLSSIPWDKIQEGAYIGARNFAAFLNGFFASGEGRRMFEETGNFIAQALNTGLIIANTLFEHVQFRKIGENIGHGINRFVGEFDWDLLGKTIGNGLNAAANFARGFFKTTDFEKIGNSISESLNKAISTVDWDNLGRALADPLNAIIDTAFGAFTTFDWRGAGKAASTAVNGWVNEIQWDKAGQTLGEGVKGLISSVNEFLFETDWFEVGGAIITFIKNIDWGGIVAMLVEGLAAVLGMLAKLIWGLIHDAWKAVVAWWKDVAFEDGKFTMMGLLEGIGKVFANIGQWIWDNIFMPFWNGIKRAFGISSPSTKMMEIGMFLMEGLFNGIKALIDWVFGIFRSVWEGIVSIFSVAAAWFANLFKRAWDGIVAIWSVVKGWFQNIWEGIVAVFSVVSEWFGNLFRQAWQNIVNIWQVAAGFFSGIWSGITGVFSDVTGFFGGVFQSALDKVKGIWEGAKGFFSGLWDGVKNIFSKGGNDAAKEATTGANNAMTGIDKGIRDGKKNAEGAITDVWQGVDSATTRFNNSRSPALRYVKHGQNMIDGVNLAFKTGTNVLVGTMNTLMNSISNVVRQATPSFVQLFRDMMNQVVTAINQSVPAVTGAIRSVMDAAVNTANGYVSTFYNIGLNMMNSLANGIRAGQHAVVSAIQAVANAAVSAANAALKIASPSKIFKKIGKFVIEGFAIGIVDNAKYALNAICNTLNKLENAVGQIGIPGIPHIDIPKLARGGIVDSATIAILGEKGKQSGTTEEKDDYKLDNIADVLSDFIDAFREVLSGLSNRPIDFKIDGHVIARVLIPLLEKELERRGIRIQPKMLLGGAK